VPAYALALSFAVTAPLLAPGYLLLRDAVSTPRSYLTDAALGLSEAAPRALPQDFAVAVASHVIDGGVVVKILVLVGLWLAGWGAARLAAVVVPESGGPGQVIAVTLAIWNPYVAERLLQGHWSLLVGYGCLPWVAAAVLRLRTAGDGGSGPIWALVFFIALAGLTPTGLMLATATALVCVAVPGDGRSRSLVASMTLAAALCSAAPWLVAAVAADSVAPSQAAGVAAFAARAEPGLGTLGSLAGLGGIWNSEAVPDSRASLFAVVATAVLLGIVAVGSAAAWRRASARPLLVLAAAAVVIPALMATGPGLAVVESVIRTVPGLGVVRDGQKWVALAVPGYTLAGAAAVLVLRRRIPAVAVAAVCCTALIAVLPDLVWGVGGKMTAVSYPSGWAGAAAVINANPAPVAVLPPDSMRRFDWAGDAPVLDPLPRWVRAEVLSTGDLTIGGQTVPGEGRRAREVQSLILGGADGDALARAGVGWVVVEGGDIETGFKPTNLNLPVAYQDDAVTVYRVGGEQPAAANRGLLIAVHLVWLATLVGSALGAVTTAVVRRRARATD
jgi:hypothetical protein